MYPLFKIKVKRILKGQSKMDNPEKLATYIGYTRRRKTQHNMC
jgi:hypothetical protein